jgi:hypothetical protein
MVAAVPVNVASDRDQRVAEQVGHLPDVHASLKPRHRRAVPQVDADARTNGAVREPLLAQRTTSASTCVLRCLSSAVLPSGVGKGCLAGERALQRLGRRFAGRRLTGGVMPVRQPLG